VDYFGPIEVIIFGGPLNSVAVFSLAWLFALSKMAYSLDTSSFISDLDRFKNRRGVPVSYHSENGTNFVGAQRSLAKMNAEYEPKRDSLTSWSPAIKICIQSTGRSTFWSWIGAYSSLYQDHTFGRSG
jgi:hypothetical protein